MTWSDIFAGWRVNLACYILRWVEAHMDTINYWYPKILILHLDENKEWLVDCQKLIAVAEWIKEGVIINIVALLCEVCNELNTLDVFHFYFYNPPPNLDNFFSTINPG